MELISLIGCAAGAASNNQDCRLGPHYMQNQAELFKQHGMVTNWLSLIELSSIKQGLAVFPDLNKCLMQLVHTIIENKSIKHGLTILGGDHSIAMGSWLGLMSLYENLGLLWVDAHMDAHTPTSSLTKNIHGMPLSYLLGIWDYPGFKPISPRPYLKPENVVVLGVRSYEPVEYTYLQERGVKIFFMQDIQARGLTAVLSDALEYLLAKVDYIGLSIDLDGIDPEYCPGVGYRVKNGIQLPAFLDFFKQLSFKSWVGLEIAEFNPRRDIDNKTAEAIVDIIKAVYF